MRVFAMRRTALLFSCCCCWFAMVGPVSPTPVTQHGVRLPRRNDFVAYNLHKIISPRDINDLDAKQARRAMYDVQQTIAEVQRLLSLDPSLPRLTRGEIEELFENVTREELTKSLRNGDHNRAQHMRALMLVLPYHTNNLSPENLQQIYTRPPVTRIVGDIPGPQYAPAELFGGIHGITPSRQIGTTSMRPPAQTETTPTTTTKYTEAPHSTTAVPITTIRFSMPRPTTFHPAFDSNQRLTEMKRVTLRKEEINDILASIGLFNQAPGPSAPTFRPMPAVITTTPVSVTTSEVPSVTEQPTTIINDVTATVERGHVNNEVKELLRSFGLLNENEQTVALNPLPEITENLADIQPASLIRHETLKVEESVPIEEPKLDMGRPQVKPDDYVAFKPLPLGTPKLDDDLNKLLKSFGLLETGTGTASRNKKSMQQDEKSSLTGNVPMNSMPEIHPDLVAPQMFPVLGTLGIHTSSARREKSSRKLDPPADFDHGGNGIQRAERIKVNNEDYRKLQQLWETIQQLEKLNANLTEDSLDALNLKNFNLSETLLAQGPDPLQHYEANKLNEIKKRQQPSDDSTANSTDSPTRFTLDLDTNGTVLEDTKITQIDKDDGSSALEIISTTRDEATAGSTDDADDADRSSTASTSTTSTTTTESARSAALEDSFPAVAGDPVNEEPLPAPRRNGFYFLYDWNSFLEVGEDPNKVIIRYSPQAGDPSRFLPVNVP